MGVLEKCGSVVAFIIGGSFFLVFIGFAIALYVFMAITAVAESQWAFVNIVPSRVCPSEQHHDCMTRTPGRVHSVRVDEQQGVTVNVAVDKAPYLRAIDSLNAHPPKVGSRVVLEEWNGRLVSVVDPQHGRRHAENWPRPIHDTLEAVGAFAVVLGVPALIFWAVVAGRRSAKRIALSEQHAQTS